MKNIDCHVRFCQGVILLYYWQDWCPKSFWNLIQFYGRKGPNCHLLAVKRGLTFMYLLDTSWSFGFIFHCGEIIFILKAIITLPKCCKPNPVFPLFVFFVISLIFEWSSLVSCNVFKSWWTSSMQTRYL